MPSKCQIPNSHFRVVSSSQAVYNKMAFDPKLDKFKDFKSPAFEENSV